MIVPPEAIVAPPRPKEVPVLKQEKSTELAEVSAPASIGSQASTGATADELPTDPGTNIAPDYPADAVRNRQEGRVMLRLKVSELGTVEEIYVETSSGVASLDQSALKTVRNWKFYPATRGGKPIAYEFIKPITFSIRNRRP